MIRGMYSRIKRLFVQLPVAAFTLSDRSLVRSIVTYVRLVYFSLTRKRVLKGRRMRFSFVFRGHTFELELFDNLDVAVLVEVFALHEYVWDPGFTPRTILDLGAHWGDTALFYAMSYPEAKIISVEPAPATFKRLQTVTGPFKNITPVQGAISATDEPVDLYLFESSLGNSFVSRSDTSEVVSVTGVTVERLLDQNGGAPYDLIKFDIEGAEEILFASGSLRKYARAYIGEIHLDLMSMSLDEVKAVFADFEYNLVSIGKNRYILRATQRS